MENLKDKLSRGFKRGSKFLVAAELLHRIVDKNEPIRPSLLLQLLNRAHKEVYFISKKNYALGVDEKQSALSQKIIRGNIIKPAFVRAAKMKKNTKS